MDNNYTDEYLEQLLRDFDKVMGMFTKMENSSLGDVEKLKEELNLLQNELKDRYGEEDTSETDSPEA
jgi:Asp-tRNA(Asn)/Glu-tRNA(Gln) amidotransferase C subunit